jgi:hypothetical protein
MGVADGVILKRYESRPISADLMHVIHRHHPAAAFAVMHGTMHSRHVALCIAGPAARFYIQLLGRLGADT